MYITYKKAQIHYTDEGAGRIIVLLHGFLENKEMWNTMVPTLIKEYRVVCIDLLGHGKSECLGYVHTIDTFAEAVYEIIKHLKLQNITIIGHSMGGYVGLAFAKSHPEMIKGLCLLNSTPEVDSEERKKIRLRANELAKKMYTQLITMSITNLFDPALKAQFENEISATLTQALQTPPQGYIAANSGMLERKESTEFWKKSTFKKGLILGINDPIIEAKYLQNKLQNSSDYLVIIEGGHMPHITNAHQTLDHILAFLRI